MWFKILPSPPIVWFQFRILHRIIGVNRLRNQMDSQVSDSCRLCGLETETISHLFAICPKSKILWDEVKHYILYKRRIHINFDVQTIVFGYLLRDSNEIPLNVIILIVKRYIFYCALNQQAISFNALMNILKLTYNEMKFAASMTDKLSDFSKHWNIWEPVFVG